jgi:hypothetical protein
MASKLEQNEKELTDKICALILRGSPRSTAAAAVGIRLATFNDWLRKGAKGKQPFKRFAGKVDEAEAGVEGLMARQLVLAAKKDWRAAEVFLKARFPERWAARDADAVKDINRLLAIMAGVLKPKDFKTVLELWDHRKTIGDD